jgi:hypothetical protein
MQNFTDNHLPIVDDTLTVPGATGAFADAADVAAIAARTRLRRRRRGPARRDL